MNGEPEFDPKKAWSINEARLKEVLVDMNALKDKKTLSDEEKNELKDLKDKEKMLYTQQNYLLAIIEKAPGSFILFKYR